MLGALYEMLIFHCCTGFGIDDGIGKVLLVDGFRWDNVVNIRVVDLAHHVGGGGATSWVPM